MKKTFAVIGLGKFGKTVLETLVEKGAEVIAIDKDQDLVNDVKEITDTIIKVDATDEHSLKASGITEKEIDVAIVTIGDDEKASIWIVALLKKLGIPEIIARATDELHTNILKEIGATRVVLPEKDSAIQLAETLLMPGEISKHIPLSDNFSLEEIEAKNTDFVGKKIVDLKIRQDFGLFILVIKKKDESKDQDEKEFIPKADYIIKEDDTLYIFGEVEDIKKFLEKLDKKNK